MESNELDKSEQPTPFKLMRARRRGVVARSLDLGFATSLAAFLGYMWMEGTQLAYNIAEASRHAITTISEAGYDSSSLTAAASPLFWAMARPLILLVVCIFLTVLLFEIVQTGAVFSGQPLKPDFSRLNPAKGIKRIFSWRMAIETIKNIIKLSAYSFMAYLVIVSALESKTASVTNGARLLAFIVSVSGRLLLYTLVLAVLFAVLDQILVRRQFGKTMRMSRGELKREIKDREGDPRLKQKRKLLHGEFARTSQSIRNLRGADVLVANPDHIAIALRYEARTMPAPSIVSVAVNGTAQRLKRLALLYNIPVIENRALARQLYKRARLNSFIPEDCFAPVAQIYNELTSHKAPADPSANNAE